MEISRAQAVYLVELIGRALESTEMVRELNRDLGTFGVEQLHNLEVELAERFDLPIYMPTRKES